MTSSISQWEVDIVKEDIYSFPDPCLYSWMVLERFCMIYITKEPLFI